VLVPEPELRYGLKQIKQNSWFQKYKPPYPTANHLQDIKVHNKLLREMKEQRPDLDITYARCCIMANRMNGVMAHYQLLLKKKIILQESVSEFSQLGLLDADAENQIELKKNLIPIPAAS